MKLHCIALLIGALSSAVGAANPSPDAVECFEWFATLGFPDVRKATFARYTNGSWGDSGSGSKQEEKHGFVIEDSEQQFQVLTPAWEVIVRNKTEPDAPAHERAAWTEAALSDYDRTLLDELRHPKDESKSLRRFGERLRYRAETFGFAFAAWRKGLPDLSQDLYNEACRMTTYQDGPGPVANLRTRLEQDFGHAAMWRAVVAFGGCDNIGAPLVPRTDLLRMFENIILRYPASEHIPRARETAAMLKLMIQEDDAHAAITDEAIEKQPVAERAHELIFRLRDQHAYQLDSPGWPDILTGPPTRKTPAHRLVQIGLDAVPALIAALSDKRFCRAVGFWRDYCFSHRVLSIGDCSLAVLQHIAGQSFYEHLTISSQWSDEEREAAARKAVEVWWADVQKKVIKKDR